MSLASLALSSENSGFLYRQARIADMRQEIRENRALFAVAVLRAFNTPMGQRAAMDGDWLDYGAMVDIAVTSLAEEMTK